MTERRETPPEAMEIAKDSSTDTTPDVTFLNNRIAQVWESIDQNMNPNQKRADDVAEYEALLAQRNAITKPSLQATPESAGSEKLTQAQLGGIFDNQTTSERRTVGPRITGYGSMDKFGKYGKSIHTRRNTKR